MEILRSPLFVPGNRFTMIEKARHLPADALVLDLEDSVPEAEKESAVQQVQEVLPSLARKGRDAYVRVNGLSTGRTAKELEVLVGPALNGILLPKASAADVASVDAILSSLEKARGLAAGHVRVIALAENAKGVLTAFEIAVASSRIVAIAYGAEDFTLDMGIPRTLEGAESYVPRVMVAIAARAAGVLALDGPYPAFKDEDGLVKDACTARGMGYTGKFAIHPAQIAPLHRVFSPPSEEVERAKAIVAAFEEAQSRGSASVSLGGIMVDVPVAERARKVLDWAKTITDKEAGHS